MSIASKMYSEDSNYEYNASRTPPPSTTTTRIINMLCCYDFKRNLPELSKEY